MSVPTEEDLYRQLHTGTPGDEAFYQRIVERKDTVLELGCGWGRLTRLIAPSCARICGLEINATFCAEAAASLSTFPNATVHVHDLREPWGPAPLSGDQSGAGSQRDAGSETAIDNGRFSRVIAPYNVLYALGGSAGVKKALRLVRDQLAPGGEFWGDIYPMDGFHMALEEGQTPPEDDDEPVGELIWEGRSYPVLESTDLTPSEQFLQATYRAVFPDDLGKQLVSSVLRHDYLLLPQLEILLEEAGLHLELVLGGFDGRRFDEDAEQLIFCARAD